MDDADGQTDRNRPYLHPGTMTPSFLESAEYELSNILNLAKETPLSIHLVYTKLTEHPDKNIRVLMALPPANFPTHGEVDIPILAEKNGNPKCDKKEPTMQKRFIQVTRVDFGHMFEHVEMPLKGGIA